jgi:hypothetical protein
MARFKKARRIASRVYSAAKSGYKKVSRPSISIIDVMLAGAIYGAARPTVSNMLPNFFQFGPVDSDNVIMGAGGYFASKSKSKLLRALGLVALGTEAGIIVSRVVAPVVQDSMDPAMIQTY